MKLKRKDNLIEDKNMPDVSGHNGMQKLFHMEYMITGMQEQIELINIYLANNWKIKKMKKSDTGMYILLEYSDMSNN